MRGGKGSEGKFKAPVGERRVGVKRGKRDGGEVMNGKKGERVRRLAMPVEKEQQQSLLN